MLWLSSSWVLPINWQNRKWIGWFLMRRVQEIVGARAGPVQTAYIRPSRCAPYISIVRNEPRQGVFRMHQK
jgi:hypothetical protein